MIQTVAEQIGARIDALSAEDKAFFLEKTKLLTKDSQQSGVRDFVDKLKEERDTAGVNPFARFMKLVAHILDNVDLDKVQNYLENTLNIRISGGACKNCTQVNRYISMLASNISIWVRTRAERLLDSAKALVAKIANRLGVDVAEAAKVGSRDVSLARAKFSELTKDEDVLEYQKQADALAELSANFSFENHHTHQILLNQYLGEIAETELLAKQVLLKDPETTKPKQAKAGKKNTDAALAELSNELVLTDEQASFLNNAKDADAENEAEKPA